MAEREYQTIAIDRTFDYLRETTGNGVIAMPTGTGKSHVISGIIRRTFDRYPSKRVQMLVHVKELIEQNAAKLKEAWPGAPLGIYSAGLGIKQSNMPITMAGIMSVKDKPNEFDAPDLILVDECHLISPSAETTYQEYIAAQRKRNKFLRVVGLTATDWRMGQGKLTNSGGLFDDTIIDMTKLHVFNRFIAEGYLSNLISRPMETYLDVSGVGMSGDDLNMSQVQTAVDVDRITWQAMQELAAYGHMRRKWLIFAAGVEHADHIAETLNRMGFPTTVVHRHIPAKERRQRIIDYKAGKYRAMVNNNILTTGFDDPTIDLIGVMRPSMSSSLWVQMLGRGTRPFYGQTFINGNFLSDRFGNNLDTPEGRIASILANGKPNCLVLDFARNTENLGPINDPVLPKQKTGRVGEAPIKLCESKRLKAGYTGCGAYNHTLRRTCEKCNAEFDFSVKYGSDASNLDIVSTGEDDFKWFDVIMTSYESKIGPSGKPYLKVNYWVSKSKKFSDFVHLEATNYVLHLAKQWWLTRFAHPEWGAPPTVEKALTKCNSTFMREPKKIRVWVNKQPYPEIVNYEYE